LLVTGCSLNVTSLRSLDDLSAAHLGLRDREGLSFRSKESAPAGIAR
jgi:hypothetical protein